MVRFILATVLAGALVTVCLCGAAAEAGGFGVVRGPLGFARVVAPQRFVVGHQFIAPQRIIVQPQFQSFGIGVQRLNFGYGGGFQSFGVQQFNGGCGAFLVQ